MTTTTATLHDVRLPTYAKPEPIVSAKEIEQPDDVAQTWLSSFEKALASADPKKVKALIVDDGWWRDHLALSWDLRTLRGSSKIADFLQDKLAKLNMHNLKLQSSGLFQPRTQEPIPGLEWIESMFSFETSVGSGKGMLRLVCTSNGTWRAHMLYTVLSELKDQPQIIGSHRPHGGNISLKGGAIEGNWYERRERQKEFLDDEPTVLVIGAGQAGLNMGARLQALGISCVIVDKNERVGDNWRYRYRTLVTHDPVQVTHLSLIHI